MLITTPFLQAFTLFCGLGIFNVINFERLLKANNAQKVVLEVSQSGVCQHF